MLVTWRCSSLTKHKPSLPYASALIMAIWPRPVIGPLLKVSADHKTYRFLKPPYNFIGVCGPIAR